MPIYNNKEDIWNCTNHRSIKLISHKYNCGRELLNKTKTYTTISENQFGFMLKRSTTEAKCIKRLIEKFRKKEKTSHLVFSDLEKAYGKIPGEIIRHVLEKKHVHKW